MKQKKYLQNNTFCLFIDLYTHIKKGLWDKNKKFANERTIKYYFGDPFLAPFMGSRFLHHPVYEYDKKYLVADGPGFDPSVF